MKEIISALNDKTVESSQGWRVVILSLDALKYSEKDKTITLQIEDRPDVGGELTWIIYLPANWIWDSAKKSEPVAPEKVSEILNHIETAFWKLDMKIKEYV